MTKDNKRKKRTYVYLAGGISDDPTTYEWRDKFIELTQYNKSIVPVNPCGNPFNRAVLNVHRDERKKMIRKSENILRAKDYQMVKISNVVVVNLNLDKYKKPLIGTVQELGWCRDKFNIPVISIENQTNEYTEHRWIRECISLKTSNVEEAIEAINFYFMDY